MFHLPLVHHPADGSVNGATWASVFAGESAASVAHATATAAYFHIEVKVVAMGLVGLRAKHGRKHARRSPRAGALGRPLLWSSPASDRRAGGHCGLFPDSAGSPSSGPGPSAWPRPSCRPPRSRGSAAPAAVSPAFGLPGFFLASAFFSAAFFFAATMSRSVGPQALATVMVRPSAVTKAATSMALPVACSLSDSFGLL